MGSEWEDVDQAEGQKEEGSGKGKQKAKSKDEEKGDVAFRYDVAQRRNIFDDDELDVTRVRVRNLRSSWVSNPDPHPSPKVETNLPKKE